MKSHHYEVPQTLIQFPNVGIVISEISVVKPAEFLSGLHLKQKLHYRVHTLPPPKNQ